MHAHTFAKTGHAEVTRKTETDPGRGSNAIWQSLAWRPTVQTTTMLQRQVNPAANQEDWNFTPADLAALHQRRSFLHFGPDSDWVPVAIRRTLLSTLDQMLSTQRSVGIPATMGVSLVDLFHCHVVVPERLRVAATTPERMRLESGLRTEQNLTRGQFQNRDITDANRAAFRQRLEAEQRAATPLLESVLQMPEAGLVIHSFEGNLEQFSIASTSSQRNWFANFQTMTARPFEAEPGEAGFSNQWTAFMSFVFLIDSSGMIHVRSGSSGFQGLSDVTGRNEGGTAGLAREIAGLDQPSFPELSFRREELREAARRRALAGPVERGRGRSVPGEVVFLDSLTNPSRWSRFSTSQAPQIAGSYHEPLSPPNFVLVGDVRFNLNADGSVSPRVIRTQ